MVHVATYLAGGDATSVPVHRTLFNDWLDVVEKEPVLLLHGQPLRRRGLQLRVLCLHDWMLREAARDPRWYDTADLPLTAFKQVVVGRPAFHDVVIREIDRVAGFVDGVWRTLHDEAMVPLDEVTFLRFVELARFLEVPRPVLERLAASGSPSELLVDRIEGRGYQSDPMIDRWLATAQQLSWLEPVAVPRRQLRHFTRFVEQRGQGVRLPRYTSRNAGYWRVFTAKYPDALQGIAHVIQASSLGSNVAFAASLLSTLTLGNDRVVSLRAEAVLRDLANRTQDFPQYYVRREILRSLAEAGEARWLSRALQIVAEEGATGAEQRYLNAYGWTTDIVQAKITRRLDFPTLRDQRMRDHLEVMAHVASTQGAVKSAAY
jgi:hypothetical protein